METDGTYIIDPEQSTIRFRTRALFGLLPVRGTFRISHGKISVTDPVTDSAVEAVVSAGSFDSGNQERDDHVRSADFLDVETHPDITFRGGGVEESGDRRRLHGELTVRGVTRPVTLDLDSVDEVGGRLTARAQVRIDRRAFGVTKWKGMTGRHLWLTLVIVASR